MTNDWAIKARVLQKVPIKEWNNQRGQGKFFKVILVDQREDQIEGTFFNEQVDQWFDKIQEGKIYRFAGGQIKLANLKFATVPNNYAITFDRSTNIIELEDDFNITQQKLNLISLSTISDLDPLIHIDVCGQIVQLGSVQYMQTKQGTMMAKRNIEIVDDSGTAVDLNLLGQNAEMSELNNLDTTQINIIVAKACKINEYRGIKSLQSDSMTTLIINPQNVELPQSYKNRIQVVNKIESIRELREKNYATLQELNYLMETAPIGFSSNYNIAFFPSHFNIQNISYPACTTESCKNKKLLQQDNQFECSQCKKLTNNPELRFMATIRIIDSTDSIWATGFDNAIQSLLNITANQLRDLGSDELISDYLLSKCYKQFDGYVKVEVRNVNDTRRGRVSLISARPIDYRNLSNYYLKQINSLI